MPLEFTLLLTVALFIWVATASRRARIKRTAVRGGPTANPPSCVVVRHLGVDRSPLNEAARKRG